MADLSALLEQEASAEVDTILSEARTRASEIVAKAKEEAEALTAQSKRSSEMQHDAALVRAKSSAQLEASSMRLNAQHKAVEDVMSEARNSLEKLAQGKDFDKTFAGLLDEALEAVGGKDNVEAVVVNSDDKATAEKAADKHGLKSKVETSDSVKGGVRLRQSGGKVAIENTLYERLDALQDELAADVSKVLFGEA